MKKILSIMLVVVMTFALVACTTEQVVRDEPVILRLHETWAIDAPFVTPITSNISTTHGIAYYLPNFYETLVVYEDGEYKPNLADSWEISEDGMVYTFKLKEGIMFSDGELLNAEAVKLNFDAVPVMMGMNAGAFGFTSGNIESTNVIDEYTFELHLKKPYYGTINDLCLLLPHGIMSPNAIGDDLMPSEASLTTSFGTGPYMYAGDFENNTFTFVRNPNYHGEEPDVDGFSITVITDPEAAALALRNSEIDFITGSKRLSLDAFNQLENEAGYTALLAESFESIRYMTFNTGKFPFNDSNVRNAVAMGLDKQAISDSAYYGYANATDRLFPEFYPYSSGLANSKSYDIESAKALLEENGYVDSDGDGIREKDGERLAVTFQYIASTASEQNAVLVMSEQLKDLGFEVEANGADLMTWYGELMQDNFNISYYYTYGTGYDPYGWISNMRSTSMMDLAAKQVALANPDVDALIDVIGVSTDDRLIQENYDQIFTYISDNSPIIPLIHIPGIAVYNSDIIADYDFSRGVTYIDVSKITLK